MFDLAGFIWLYKKILDKPGWICTMGDMLTCDGDRLSISGRSGDVINACPDQRRPGGAITSALSGPFVVNVKWV